MRKFKPFRKRMYAVICTDKTRPSNYPLVFTTKAEADSYLAYPQDRIIRVLVSEIPAKSKGRRK